MLMSQSIAAGKILDEKVDQKKKKVDQRGVLIFE